MKTLVAVGQLCSGSNKSENLDACEGIIDKARLLGARFISLPENFAFLGSEEDDARRAAEAIDGPSITRLRKCAKKQGVWLSLGGFQESIGQSKIFNTHVVINDVGEIAATYRKMHLFSVTLPDGSVYDEAKSVMPGSEVVVFETPYFKGGLSICYDLRFAQLYAALRSKNADVMVVPAAFSHVTGPAHWEVLLRARAIETQSYVVAAAQSGKHNARRSTHGHAMIIDPWGTVLAQCGLMGDLGIAEIDLVLVRKLREEMPIWQHRKLLVDESR